jgi:hypothetical protein
VRARCVVAAKCIICLAVTAAGGWLSSAVAVYLLARILGAWWGCREYHFRPEISDNLAVRVVSWCRRFEVTGAVTLVTARSVAAHYLGLTVAADMFELALIVALSVPWTRKPLRVRLVRERSWRRWTNTLVAVVPAPGTPTVTDTGVVARGEWAQVRIGPGSTVKDLIGRADAIAAGLAVAIVKVDAVPGNAGWARITALRSDPLAVPAPAWPWLEMPTTSLWKPIPVGVDETGQEVTVTLAEHNLLLGGEPGAGKSVALSQLVAAAALDPYAGLWLLDGKVVELAAWQPGATGSAATDIVEAIAVLRHVAEVMDDRYRQLLETGRRKIDSSIPLQVVVIDELAHYLTWGDKKPRDAFTDVLRDLVSRGRAAGIVVIAATQKPSSDVVPTSLRDLFGYRWALRCTTNAASDTILGSGWASEGVSAASIAPDTRGVGWLLHESGLPVRLRAHHLDDQSVARLAARAAALQPPTDLPEHSDD